jgi:hypothetical protein
LLLGLIGLAGCALDEPVHGYGYYGTGPSYGYATPYAGYGSYGYARPRVYSPPAYVARPPVVVVEERRRDWHQGRRDWDRRQTPRQPEYRPPVRQSREGWRDPNARFERSRVRDTRSPADRGDLGG